MNINCSKCGDPVSTEVECPDCAVASSDSALRALARAVVESRADGYMHVTVDPAALDLLAEAVR